MQARLVCAGAEPLFKEIREVVEAPGLAKLWKRLTRCASHGLAEGAGRRKAELVCNGGRCGADGARARAPRRGSRRARRSRGLRPGARAPRSARSSAGLQTTPSTHATRA